MKTASVSFLLAASLLASSDNCAAAPPSSQAKLATADYAIPLQSLTPTKQEGIYSAIIRGDDFGAGLLVPWVQTLALYDPSKKKKDMLCNVYKGSAYPLEYIGHKEVNGEGYLYEFLVKAPKEMMEDFQQSGCAIGRAPNISEIKEMSDRNLCKAPKVNESLCA